MNNAKYAFVSDRMLVAFPKKSKKFSSWHEKRFHNAAKLENDEVRIGDVSFISKCIHYKYFT